ncbi:MAG: thioredoxin family protein [Byssovorax sp.]
MRPLLLALILLLCPACSGEQTAPGDARKVVVSLQNIDCSECGDQIVADLRERPGVYAATFDKRSAEVRVVASPSFDVFTAVRQLSAQQGFLAILGEGKGHYSGEPPYPPGADVKTLTKGGGEVIPLEVALVKGKLTVIDFTASWCRPCHQIDDHMVKVLAAHPDIAYRRLDIGDWDTPLAQRYLKSVSKLPFVMVFDRFGQKVDELSGIDFAALDAAIDQAASRK